VRTGFSTPGAKEKNMASEAKSEEKVLGTKEMAAKLKIEPRQLRVVLRSMGKCTGGERYEFKDKDLPKLAQAVKEYEAKKAEAAKQDKGKKAS
jgi:hypothetical protein